MAGRGPAPKPTTTRRRRSGNPAHPTAAAAGPELRACPLAPSGDPWPPNVVRWWEQWRDTWGDRLDATDWEQLDMLCPLVATYWETFDAKTLAEIRVHEDGLRRRALVRPARPSANPSDGGTTPAPDRSAKSKAAERFGGLRAV